MRRRDGSPLWVSDSPENALELSRADLNSNSTTGYDEKWLQALLHHHPRVFPIEQIEPGFGELIPLCRELPLTFAGGRAGQVDNLFTTRDGGLVIVEAKLWRNPEARRSAVAQAMEYASAVFDMNYDQLETAVLKARVKEKATELSLFQIVSSYFPDIDEAGFFDALSRNLRRGRAIIAVVGDGIREDIMPLANLLQSHAGHRFTFVLVELTVYETPAEKVRLIMPSVLAQTALIERGVVRLEGDAQQQVRIEIAAPLISTSENVNRSTRRISLGEDEFYELLGERDLSLPVLLKDFIVRAGDLGVYRELQGGLNLKHSSSSGPPLNLGTIRKDGFVDTGPATWWGRTLVGQAYNETLAQRIGGFVSRSNNGQESAVRTNSKRMPQLSDLLPAHQQAWLEAIERYIRDNFRETEQA